MSFNADDNDTLARLDKANGNMPVADGSNWQSKTSSEVKTALGLGTSSDVTFSSLTLSGDLTVNGTTTTINSTTVATADKNIELGKTASPSDATANGGGITLKGTTDKTILWDSNGWGVSEDINLASGKSVKVAGTKVLDGTGLFNIGACDTTTQNTVKGFLGTLAVLNTVGTSEITNSAVTLAKIANIATSRILGRSTAGSGVVEELSIGSGLSLAGGVLSVSGGSGTVTSVATGTGLTGGTITTSGTISLSTNGVGDTHIRQSAGLSVLGRAGGTTGNIADITASSNTVLRESGGTLGFGLVGTANLDNNAVTFAKMVASGTTPCIVGAPSGTSNFQEITAATNDRVLARTGGALSFTTVTGSMLAANTVGNSELRQSVGLSVLGRSGGTTGNVSDITASTDAVLRESGGTLGFGTIATGGIANSAVTLAKIANIATSRILGRSTAGSGVIEELSIGSGLTLASGTLSGQVDTKALRMANPVYASASTFTIASGAAMDSTGASLMSHTSSKTLNIATSGANGLDTGSEASSTWYYLYMIGKTDGTTDYVLSVTNELVTGSITLPSGYTLKRQMPFAVRNDGSSNFLPFLVNGREVFYTGESGQPLSSAGALTLLNSGAATTFTDVSCSSVVPAISQLVMLDIFSSGAINGRYFCLRAKGDTDNGYNWYNSAGSTDTVFNRNLQTNSSQQIQYMQTGGSGASTLSLFCQGYMVTAL